MTNRKRYIIRFIVMFILYLPIFAYTEINGTRLPDGTIELDSISFTLSFIYMMILFPIALFYKTDLWRWIKIKFAKWRLNAPKRSVKRGMSKIDRQQAKVDRSRRELAKKQAIKEKIDYNISQGIPVCMYCGSTSLQLVPKGSVSIGRAIIGKIAFGNVGAIVGASTGKKLRRVCLNCGR